MDKRITWLVCFMILLMLALLYRMFVFVTPVDGTIDNLRIQMKDQTALLENRTDTLQTHITDHDAQKNVTVEKENDGSEIIELLASSEIQVPHLLTLTDKEFEMYTVTGPEDELLNFLFQKHLLANIEIAKKIRDEKRAAEEVAHRKKLEDQEAQHRREKYQRERGNDSGAWVMTQMFIKKRLKSPSTASFGRWFEQTCGEVVTPLGNYRYRIKAWVDSQNSFGGIVRTDFTAVVREQDSKWILESIEIEN